MGPASDADQESKETTPAEPPQPATTTGVKVGPSEPLDGLDPNARGGA